jgi:hypothetical protein
VPFAQHKRTSATAHAQLAPFDLAAAQRTRRRRAARLVATGRVKALEPGLDACRSGDLAALRILVERHGWAPRSACDEHGSGPLLWAAGGGHLAVCRYLVEVCGLDPSLPADARLARRGYSGRTAAHWAARNGHVTVLRWLVGACGCAADAPTADGTTALCWAAWQGMSTQRASSSRRRAPTRTRAMPSRARPPTRRRRAAVCPCASTCTAWVFHSAR